MMKMQILIYLILKKKKMIKKKVVHYLLFWSVITLSTLYNSHLLIIGNKITGKNIKSIDWNNKIIISGN